MHELLEWREKNPEGKLGITFPNWNDDPRELWDIPEARAFTKKLLNFGILTPLTFSTSIEGPGLERDEIARLMGLGALELFMLAFFPHAEITKPIFDLAVLELRRSNRICEERYQK